MGKLVQLNPNDGTTLRQAYRSALADGYNATVELGRFDCASAQVMVGFMSAAVIALRLAGDEAWASLIECSAQRLSDDWERYEREIPALTSALDAA